MALFEKLNVKSRTVMEGVDLATLEFAPLKQFVGQNIKVVGFFFTDGKYGKQVVVVGNGYKINLPSRYVKSFEIIENDEQMLNAVLEAKLILANVRLISTNNGNTCTFDFMTNE